MDYSQNWIFTTLKARDRQKVASCIKSSFNLDAISEYAEGDLDVPGSSHLAIAFYSTMSLVLLKVVIKRQLTYGSTIGL